MPVELRVDARERTRASTRDRILVARASIGRRRRQDARDARAPGARRAKDEEKKKGKL